MNVYGRLWMAPRAGFQIDHKFLSARVVRSPDASSTPSDTPREALPHEGQAYRPQKSAKGTELRGESGAVCGRRKVIG